MGIGKALKMVTKLHIKKYGNVTVDTQLLVELIDSANEIVEKGYTIEKDREIIYNLV